MEPCLPAFAQPSVRSHACRSAGRFVVAIHFEGSHGQAPAFPAVCSCGSEPRCDLDPRQSSPGSSSEPLAAYAGGISQPARCRTVAYNRIPSRSGHVPTGDHCPEGVQEQGKSATRARKRRAVSRLSAGRFLEPGGLASLRQVGKAMPRTSPVLRRAPVPAGTRLSHVGIALRGTSRRSPGWQSHSVEPWALEVRVARGACMTRAPRFEASIGQAIAAKACKVCCPCWAQRPRRARCAVARKPRA